LSDRRYILHAEVIFKEQAQLMLTNPSVAFISQSRSPTMVPFDMLGMASY